MKSSSSLKFRNVLRILAWKSFHLSEYCCSPLDEDEDAAMASVPSGPTAEGIKGAIVLTPRGHPLTSPCFTFSLDTPAVLPEDFQGYFELFEGWAVNLWQMRLTLLRRSRCYETESLIFVDAVDWYEINAIISPFLVLWLLNFLILFEMDRRKSLLYSDSALKLIRNDCQNESRLSGIREHCVGTPHCWIS